MKFTEAKTMADLNPKTRKFINWATGIVFVLLVIVCFIPSDGTYHKDTKYIDGFDPVDTYLNLKEWGFVVKSDYDTQSGKLWTCTRVDDGITHVVTMYSPDGGNKATSARMTVTVEPGYASLSQGRYFTEKFATIIYDLCDQTLARQFVSENYDRDKASIIIGDAEFTIYAPSNYVRILDINNYSYQDKSQE